ncbi:MAG: C40 family peptidase [Planctomycetes bacterium]|nr:C40 family peptidase [Planctomycetota bacterium]
MRPPAATTLALAFTAAIAPITSPLAAQQPFSLDAAERLLAECKRELAPDRRVRVFDVAVSVAQGKAVLEGEVHDRELRAALLERFGKRGDVDSVDLRALPAPEVADQPFAVVASSVANLRSKPGHAQELATQVLLGMPLRVLKEEDGWLYVQAPNDYLGWTNNRLQRMNANEFADWRERDKVVVTATYAEVRRGPGDDAPVLADVVAGGMLALDGQKGDCFVVGYPDGRTGCLPKRAAQPFGDWLKDAADEPSRLVATAQRFHGVPYLWGGTSTKGMDCSGFVSTTWLLNGVLLPRDASQQVTCGVEVPTDPMWSKVQPGDLLFFGRAATASRPERVTHVGISLGGPWFLHESTDVHENSLDPAHELYSESLLKSLLHVRRVVGADAAHGVVHLRDHPLYLPSK